MGKENTKNIEKETTFFNNFITAINKKKIYELLLDYYPSRTKWTKFIKVLVENEVLKDKENISEEYYRIDTLQYEYTSLYKDYNKTKHKEFFNVKQDDKDKNVSNNDNNDKDLFLNVYNWKNKCAIEYENDRHTWTDELVKLSHIRSDLKVIIAYSQYGEEKPFNSENEEKNQKYYKDLIKAKLEFAVELLNGCEKQSLDDNWLIIFGPAKGKYWLNKFEGNLEHFFKGYYISKENEGYSFKELEYKK